MDLELHGTIQARALTLPDGQGVSKESINGFHVYALDEQPMFENLGLTAEKVLANFTHGSWRSVARNPLNPDQMVFGGPKTLEYREEQLTDVTLTATHRYDQSNLLFESAGAESRLTMGSATSWNVEGPERWWGGYHFPGQTTEANPLTYFVEPIGRGLFGASNAIQYVKFEGNFRLYVWGATVSIDTPSTATRTNLTGVWAVDATSLPNGYTAQQESHAQLLRLDVVNGTLNLERLQGGASWASHVAQVATNSTLVFDSAIADLQSARWLYQSQQRSVSLTGQVEARFGGPLEGSRFTMEVLARNSTLDMKPTGDVRGEPSPLGGRSESVSNDPATASSIVPSHPIQNAVAFWLGLGATVGASGIFLFTRRSVSRRETHRLLRRSEGALLSGNLPECEDLAEQALQLEPLNGRAWFLTGASLLKRGEHDRASRLLWDVVEQLDQDVSGLAYLLSLSLHKAGRVSDAKRWLSLVARDPQLWESLGQETDFELVVKHVIGRTQPDASYN